MTASAQYLLLLCPGTYTWFTGCLAAGQGFHASADVALVAAPLSVLDADLSFEVRGPAKSAAEARKQQQKYAAAKEARRLLGEAALRCGSWRPATIAGTL